MELLSAIQVDLFCALVLLVVALNLDRRVGEPGRESRSYALILWSTFALLCLDALSRAAGRLDGGRPQVFLVAGSNALYFALHALPSIGFLAYAESLPLAARAAPGAAPRRLSPAARAATVLAATLALVALSSPWTGFVFAVDPVAGYRRGPGFGLFGAFQFLIFFIALVPVLSRREGLRRETRLILLAYPVLVGLAALLQGLRYGLVLVWPVATLFILAAAMGIQRRRGSTDHLTGTANRRSLDPALARLAGHGPAHRPFGGIMVDLDDFKGINDSLGHEAGDRALEDAADMLQAAVRREDLVGRWGGDEFLVLLPGAGEEALREVVGRLERRAEAQVRSSRRPYRLSFSVGAAAYDPEAHGSAEAFVAALDRLMYEDKGRRKRDRAAGADRGAGRG